MSGSCDKKPRSCETVGGQEGGGSSSTRKAQMCNNTVRVEASQQSGA